MKAGNKTDEDYKVILNLNEAQDPRIPSKLWGELGEFADKI